VCSILVIDDHRDTREAIGELIGHQGHSHHGVGHGREALDWLEAQAEPPCLILLDLRMPVMDGWDFLRALRATSRWNDVGVIVISATIDIESPAPVLPAKAFWSKPPNADLVTRIHEYCERHRDSWPAKAE
jgi:two-component system, chemotaxis family, chemotaxis protein CheY